jgi:hypothetical protein
LLCHYVGFSLKSRHFQCCGLRRAQPGFLGHCCGPSAGPVSGCCVDRLSSQSKADIPYASSHRTSWAKGLTIMGFPEPHLRCPLWRLDAPGVVSSVAPLFPRCAMKRSQVGVPGIRETGYLRNPSKVTGFSAIASMSRGQRPPGCEPPIRSGYGRVMVARRKRLVIVAAAHSISLIMARSSLLFFRQDAPRPAVTRQP